MRKIIVAEFVFLDGVIHAPGQRKIPRTARPRAPPLRVLVRKGGNLGPIRRAWFHFITDSPKLRWLFGHRRLGSHQWRNPGAG